MPTVRTRTLLAVAAFVIAAGGLSAAAANPGSPDARNPNAGGKPTVIQAARLFPTSATNPDPKQVVTAHLPVEGDAPVRLTAQCTCQPGTAEAAQFDHLVVEVKAPGGKVYTGPLDSLDAVVEKLANDVTVRVWLADNGEVQPQAVTTEWAFTATPG